MTPGETAELASWATAFEIQRDDEIQELLDVSNRVRTSLLPWRGQFSPQLIEHLIAASDIGDGAILDPFCGSGTVIFEAAREGRPSYGADVNPAAFLLASVARFCRLSVMSRQKILKDVKRIVDSFCTPPLGGLFATGAQDGGLNDEVTSLLQSYNGVFAGDYHRDLVLCVTLMLAMGDTATTTLEKLARSFRNVEEIIISLPYADFECRAYASDARDLPLNDNSVSLIITSPPYINVFNYHQNYRKALEIIGCHPLQVAVSEIGANRKHRQNRFMTVVQYCMDMAESLKEMKRLLRPGGKIQMIVGRTSSVRSVQFKNGQLLAMVSQAGMGLNVLKWQERCFTNRFGEKIIEDILTFEHDGEVTGDPTTIGKGVGKWALSDALSRADEERREEISQALSVADGIKLSPALKFECPKGLQHLF